jgi:hypothetical protein
METEKSKLVPKWAGLGYEQVPGLANRIIARYLRGQRRNMERFFTERGLFESADRMRQIRLSRQGMMAKNRMFQEVLNEYARRASPAVATSEASDLEGQGSADVDLPSGAGGSVDAGQPDVTDGARADADGGVPALAGEDGDRLVVEE